MWIFAPILPLFVLIGSAGIAILCNERRPLVLLCLGGMVGMIATSIALSLLGLLFGIAIATWLVLALLVSGGLAAIAYWWRKRFLQDGLGYSWKYWLLLAVLVVHFGLAAAIFWQFLVGAQGHQDVLLAHSAFTASIARGNYPVVNPNQPDDLLPYRLTFHVVGAFLTRLSGQSAPEALAGLTGILIAFLFLGLIGLGLAARLGPWRTMLAAVVFLTVGNLRWLDILRQVSLENPVFNHHTLVYSLLSNFAGSALALSVGNPSLSYGYLVALSVLTFYLYIRQAEGRRRWLVAAATGTVLGHLSAAAESWFAAILAALLVHLALQFIRLRRLYTRELLQTLLAVGAGIAVALFSPGLLSARLFGGASSGVGIRFKGEHLLDLPPGVYGSGGWIPIAETSVLWTLLALLAMIPLVLFYIWLTNDRLSWLLVLFSGACFSAFFLFTASVPLTMGRFFMAGIASFAWVAVMAAAWYFAILRRARLTLRGIALIGIACAAMPFVGSYVMYSLSLPWLADPKPHVQYRSDVAAVETFLLKNTEHQDRLLVLGGAVRWCIEPGCIQDLNRLLLSAYIAAHSGQFIPTGGMFSGGQLGYTIYSPTMALATAAQSSLSVNELLALDLTYLYASSPWLTDLHRAALAEKLARGSLEHVWQSVEPGSPQACRAFVELVKPYPGPFAAVSFAEDEKVALPGEPLQLEVPVVPNAAERSNQSDRSDDLVQATILIASSEPTQVSVQSGADYAARLLVSRAVAIRTPPLQQGAVLVVGATLGAIRVEWIEAYAPLAPESAEFLPEDLQLCNESP